MKEERDSFAMKMIVGILICVAAGYIVLGLFWLMEQIKNLIWQ